MKKIFTFLTFFVASVATAQTLTDSLIGYYPFNGNANDQSGNGNHLTINNAILTADRNGQANAAYLLNGTNAYVGMAGASQFYLDEYSYSCWFRIDALPPQGTTQAIMSVGGSIKDNGFNLSNKYVGVYSGIGSWTYHKNTQTTSSVDLPTFNDANWHHIVATRDLDSIILYLDGIKIDADYTGDGAGYTGSGLGFYIGCRTGNTLYFEGVVDDVRIWKRVLGQAEVVQLFNSTATTSPNYETKESIVTVFPNPSRGDFHIQNEGNSNLNLDVVNAIGQKVFTQNLSIGDNVLSIPVKGVYFLRLNSLEGNFIESRKIVVK